MLAIDMGMATVIAAAIAAIPATIAGVSVWIRKDLKQINKAVNHVSAGEPTLVQRVKNNEKESQEFYAWVKNALTLLARQVGVSLEEPPSKKDE
jgi:hypothetical protein